MNDQHRYVATYPAGTIVQILSLANLRLFQSSWRLHNPLLDEQLAFADHTAAVKKVMFYHGGYELYVLNDIPGIWHPECLRPANS
jgi:hypothetical protein